MEEVSSEAALKEPPLIALKTSAAGRPARMAALVERGRAAVLDHLGRPGAEWEGEEDALEAALQAVCMVAQIGPYGVAEVVSVALATMQEVAWPGLERVRLSMADLEAEAAEHLECRESPRTPFDSVDPIDAAQAHADVAANEWAGHGAGPPPGVVIEEAARLARDLPARFEIGEDMAALVAFTAFRRAGLIEGEGALWEVEKAAGAEKRMKERMAARCQKERAEGIAADREEARKDREAMMEWATKTAGEMLEADLSLCDQPPGVIANRLVSQTGGEIELVDARLAAATAYRLRGLSVDMIGGAQAVVTRGVARPLESTWFDSTIEMKAPRWLVKGLFTAEGLGLLFGESGAGKSFLAVHLALCVAYGLPFFGRKVRQGGVAFFAAEGGAGVGKRFYAAEKALAQEIDARNRKRAAAGEPALKRAKIMIVREAPNLSRTGEPERMVATLAQAKAEMAAAGEALSLAILDTWHAAMGGGEENAAEDVGEALKTLRPASCDMQVLVVHHPGKIADRGPRGSNALPAAADTVVELTVPGREGLRSKAGADRMATLTKLREGETGATFSYQLPTSVLGLDDDDEPWTTCYVQPVETAAAPVVPLSGGDKKFEASFAKSEEDGASPYNRLREEFLKGAPERATAGKAFNRALNRACEQGRFRFDEVEMAVYRAA